MKIPIKVITALRHPRSNIKPATKDDDSIDEDICSVVDLRQILSQKLE